MKFLSFLITGVAGLLCGHASWAADSAGTAGRLPPRDVYYGLNEDPVWECDTDQLPEFRGHLEQTGCGSLRIPIRWRVVEPKPGLWDFSRVDRVLEAIPANVSILATLMSVPSWANGVPVNTTNGWFDVYPPIQMATWSHYVARTVMHYQHRIKHWEIWNEQNGVDFYRPEPDVKQYAELLRVAYVAAKTADPDCVVVLGGLVMNGVDPNPWAPATMMPHYLEALYKEGARPFFDVVNIHPYVTPQEGVDHVMKLTRTTLGVMARYGDAGKPLWITETSVAPTRQPGFEQEQAGFLTRLYRDMRAEKQVERIFWFKLRDMKKDLLGGEGSMGLLSHEGRRKPAYDAFKAASE